MIPALIALGVVIVLALFLGNIYNRLVELKNRYKNAFAQIEVQLKRRYDLIPNLVEVAKGYIKHERETLESVTEARNAAAAILAKAREGLGGNSDAIAQLNGAEKALHGALSNLNIAVEAYPELKANQNMLSLQEEISSTENKIGFARQGFNDSATEYNTYRQSFPNNIFAPMFGHAQDATLLEFEDSAKMQDAPKISF